MIETTSIIASPLRRILCCALLLALLLAAAPGALSAAPLRVLDDADAALYRRIFTLQQDGEWRKADRLIGALLDRTLMGHVLFQRYMHPTRYRSSYKELRGWLQQYNDHPGAGRIYRLAMKRRPAKAAPPPRPARLEPPPAFRRSESADRLRPMAPVLPRTIRTPKDLKNAVSRLIHQGQIAQAQNRLDRFGAQVKLDDADHARLLGLLARGYFHDQDDPQARRAAAQAAALAAPEAAWHAAWWGGLAAWRQNLYRQASDHFEQAGVGAEDSGNPRTAAGAYYWAGRAWLRAGAPERVNPALQKAAAVAPQSFYGLLARRALGQTPAFDWRAPYDAYESDPTLLSIPAARRAVALLQVRAPDLATEELWPVIKDLSPAQREAMLALAHQAGLADVAHAIGHALPLSPTRPLDAAIYPVPYWRPQDGFKLDRALIYAFARQESLFRATAISRSGAQGLMQLMPATAAFMAQRSFQGAQRRKLFDPAYNLSLGQKYLLHLMNDVLKEGNLFLMAAAYNAGPGNLRRWRARVEDKDDPLLFAESLPALETRIYVKRVLANLWAYQHRFGQDLSSMDQLLMGEWPLYAPQDGPDSGAPDDLISLRASS